MNLTELLLAKAKDQVIGKVAQKAGLSGDQAGSIAASAIPLIVKGLAKNAASEKGAKGLADALDRDHDGSILDNLTGMIGADAEILDGEKILGHVLGSKTDAAADAIGQEVQVNPAQAKQVMAMLAPVVMGFLGKKKKENALGASDLAGVLSAASAQNGVSSMLSKLIDADGDGKISDDLMQHGMKLVKGFFKK